MSGYETVWPDISDPVTTRIAKFPKCGEPRVRARICGAAYWICPACHHPELIGEIYKEADR